VEGQIYFGYQALNVRKMEEVVVVVGLDRRRRRF
jgi:hypothetical protein